MVINSQMVGNAFKLVGNLDWMVGNHHLLGANINLPKILIWRSKEKNLPFCQKVFHKSYTSLIIACVLPSPSLKKAIQISMSPILPTICGSSINSAPSSCMDMTVEESLSVLK